MSIPPLVCSTPPPPDQCEDDKDHEDFGLQYHLSQGDDEDENYDYGNFSSYNHYETEITTKKIKAPIINSSIEKDDNNIKETEDNIEQLIENSEQLNICNESGTNIIIVDKLKCDEDINIEDLNLILDKESICPNTEDNDGKFVIEKNIDSSVKNLQTPSIIQEIQDHMNDCLPIEEDVVISSKVIISSDGELDTYVDDIVVEEPSVNADINKDEHDLVIDEELSKDKPFVDNEIYSQGKKDVVDDEFGEFDDFKFIRPDIGLASFVDNCENPWENKDPNTTTFGDFTANFDEIIITEKSVSLENDEIPKNKHLENRVITENYDDDDFSDFDDFKSSTNNTFQKEATVEDSLACQDVPVLNLHSTENEHQVMESINKVLTSVFQEEIIEPTNEFEGKLESLLNETWGYIMETDVRQPYIVNWNNSLGQKTLLRALCIDSRNILFGPKWGYNMPKYAANLTTAPLQPQKQVASPVFPNETASSDKSVSKPNNWGDPFSSDGQESCNSNQSAVTESDPAEVFEAALSPKSDKIYSSTLNVQPLRQINLPDTHIFTPTNSETPRSKTIHYDSGLPVLLPQTVKENCKNQSEHLTSETISSIGMNNMDNDSEYWDFQDFKSKSDNSSTTNEQDKKMQSMETKGITTSNSALPKAVQILQPIKLEPIMPTLNWPDPGEVSEVFDDFSDFVTNSSWNNNKPIDPLTSEAQNQKPIARSPDATDIKIEKDKSKDSSSVDVSNSNNDISFDDEFDRFQSAIPNSNINIGDTMDTQSVPSSQIVDFVYAFPKNDVKSDTISFSNETRLNKALSQNFGKVPSTAEITNKNQTTISSGLHSKLLQPIAASSNVTTTQNQQKSGQILQPLSLESYSQINWPSPGIDLQDLSRFNPVETLQSLKTDLSVSNHMKMTSPIHNQSSFVNKQLPDDDVWGDFVSSNPNKQQQTLPKKSPTYADDDEWTEFVSSPSVKPQNGLNTISLNVHTNLKLQKSSSQNKITLKNNQIPLEIPTLNYITPKAGNHDSCNDRHFQNL